MKTRILFVILAALMLGSFSLSAQVADVELTRKGLNLAMDGQKLTDGMALELFGQTDRYDTYKGARRQMIAGTALITVGSVASAFGIATYGIGVAGLDHTAGIVGICTEAAGMALLAAGIPLYCIGKGRMIWLTDEGNRKVAISVGPQRCGAGISVNF